MLCLCVCVGLRATRATSSDVARMSPLRALLLLSVGDAVIATTTTGAPVASRGLTCDDTRKAHPTARVVYDRPSTRLLREAQPRRDGQEKAVREEPFPTYYKRAAPPNRRPKLAPVPRRSARPQRWRQSPDAADLARAR